MKNQRRKIQNMKSQVKMVEFRAMPYPIPEPYQAQLIEICEHTQELLLEGFAEESRQIKTQRNRAEKVRQTVLDIHGIPMKDYTYLSTVEKAAEDKAIAELARRAA